MINVSKYTQSTLSKFDIIGSYFVNLFYNEFYSKSKVLKSNGSSENLTEAYKSILGSYLEFIKKPEFFRQIVKGIHAYCISTTKYTTMTHKECIDFMVHEFIPEKLWDSIRENQKNKLFHESIGNCITIFVENIINNRIHIIIDNHEQPENIIILQDLFLSIILLEKDKIYSKFLNPNNNNTISIDLFKEKLMTLVNEKKELISENNNIKKNYNIIKQLNEKNTNVIIELQKIHKLNIKEINSLKQENAYIKNLLSKEGRNEIKYNEIRYKKGLSKCTNNEDAERKNRLETLNNDSDLSDSSNSDKYGDSEYNSLKNIKKNTINLKQQSIVQKKNNYNDSNDDLNSLLCSNDSEEIDTNNDLIFDNDIDYETDN